MSEWQPIETAPRDGTRILLGHTQRTYVRLGWWNDDKYSKKPRPYFAWPGCGVIEARETQHTHWMPLPEPPRSTP